MAEWMSERDTFYARGVNDARAELVPQVERLQAELAEAVSSANTNAAERQGFADHIARCCGHGPFRPDTQESRQQAAERAVRAGIVLPRGPEA